MYIVCADMEGIFTPEIWINVAERTGIKELRLTTRDISKIVRALVDALEVSFHSRIRYPWQEKAAVKNSSQWTFGSSDKDKQSQSRKSFKM